MALRALDRVLKAGHYWVELVQAGPPRIAHWNRGIPGQAPSGRVMIAASALDTLAWYENAAQGTKKNNSRRRHGFAQWPAMLLKRLLLIFPTMFGIMADQLRHSCSLRPAGRSSG